LTTKNKLNFSVEQNTRNCHTVRMGVTNSKWEQWFLLSTDRHHDNAHTIHELETKHLKQAKERGAGIVDAGDLFCAMQGKYDRRSSRSACRVEQQGTDCYLDSLVDTASEFYAPYAENFIVIGRGNHETAILKNHETDLTDRLCDRMTYLSGHKVYSGGYGGWVRFMIKFNGSTTQCLCKYYHGSGGGGPVTRGVIQTNRMAVIYPQAQIIMSGHTHDQWIVPVAREKLHKNGKIGMDETVHVRCGTYKDEYQDGYGGWHVETGKPPKNLGAIWLRFYSENAHNNTVGWDFTRAK